MISDPYNRAERALHELAYAVNDIRKDIADGYDEISDLNVYVSFTGRVHSGDMKIEVEVGGWRGNDSNPRAGTITPAIVEFIRRQGYNKRHEALTISYVPDVQPVPDYGDADQ